MIVEVTLTPKEIYQGATAGIVRQTQNIKDGRQNSRGLPPTKDWQVHIEGALSECAFAKYMSFYWPGAGEIGEVDFPDRGWEVKWTPLPTGSLWVQKEDDELTKSVLLTGSNGIYQIRGWICAGDAKLEKWWRSDIRHPCYGVPQASLNSALSLKEMR